jgi:hypothetical protein
VAQPRANGSWAGVRIPVIMNIRTSEREQVLAGGLRSGVSATRAFPVGNQTGFLGYNRLSIPAKATRRDDGLEFSEVEIGNGCVAEASGKASRQAMNSAGKASSSAKDRDYPWLKTVSSSGPS